MLNLFRLWTTIMTNSALCSSIYLWETGLLRHVVKKLPWVPKADQCYASDASIRKSTSNQARSIKLIDLASAFFILGVGAAASLLAFLVELAVFYRKKYL